MKERPILFTGAMVRAILAGTKTQTRRPMKPQPTVHPLPEGKPYALNVDWRSWVWRESEPAPARIHEWCPFGSPGDRLWVREAFCVGYGPLDAAGTYSAIPWSGCDEVKDRKAFYAASFPEKPDEPRMRWKPSIHMPRWACRLVLEITDVRVQRLRDITAPDAVAEGVWHDFEGMIKPEQKTTANAIEAYRQLWETINGIGSWHANPWVWAISFKKCGA